MGSAGSLSSVSSSAGRLRFLFKAMRQRVGSRVHVRPGAQQFLEQGGGGAALEAGWQLQGEQAVEIVGQDGHGEIEIDLDDHGGGEPVEMEEGQLLGNRLLDQPAAGVAAQELGEGAVEVVGEQQGRAAARAGAAQDGDLAQLAVIAGEPDSRVVGAHQAGALVQRDAHLADGVGRERAGLLEQALAAEADGDEEDVVLIQAGQVGVGGEAGVEGEEADRGAMAAEEVQELEDGVGGGLAADAGVGAQEQAGIGILGEGGGEAGKSAIAGAGPVPLEGFGRPSGAGS